MVAETVMLSEARKEAGFELLRLTDAVGFDAHGGAWAYTCESEAWRFYLFSELIDTKGPIWTWERLLKAFTKLSLPPGVTPLDIIVASPDEEFYRRIPFKMDGRATGVSAIYDTGDIGHASFGIDRLWFLRARPERALKDGLARGSTARRFDLKVRQLLAA